METLVSEMSGNTGKFTHNIFTQTILSTEKKVSDLWNDRNFGCKLKKKVAQERKTP